MPEGLVQVGSPTEKFLISVLSCICLALALPVDWRIAVVLFAFAAGVVCGLHLGANAVLMLNMLTLTLTDQLAYLEHAKSIGALRPGTYVELGGEFYWGKFVGR